MEGPAVNSCLNSGRPSAQAGDAYTSGLERQKPGDDEAPYATLDEGRLNRDDGTCQVLHSLWVPPLRGNVPSFPESAAGQGQGLHPLQPAPFRIGGSQRHRSLYGCAGAKAKPSLLPAEACPRLRSLRGRFVHSPSPDWVRKRS